MSGVGLASVVAVWLALVAVPAAAFWGLARLLDLWTRPPSRCRRARSADTGRPGAGPHGAGRDGPGQDGAVVPGLDVLVADLARLDLAHRDAVERGLSAVRRRAAGLAYDDALQTCCRATGVPLPPGPLDAVARVQAEAELAARGLHW